MEDAGKSAAEPVLLERFPVAETANKIIVYLNPITKSPASRPNHQLVATAKAWMGVLELGFEAMLEATWPTFEKIEAFLLATFAPKQVPVPIKDPLRDGANVGTWLPEVQYTVAPANGTTMQLRDRPETVAVVVSPQDKESAFMDGFRTKYQMVYQSHKAEACIAHMTWQEYLTQLLHAPEGTSQVKYPLRPFSFIHMDPWYDDDNHPEPRAMQKLRRLIDLISVVGTKILIWGKYTNLADYALMLKGKYSKGKTMTVWEVDPSLACVARHISRNRVAKRGVVFKSMTEHFLMAVRTDGESKTVQEGLKERNNPSQVAELVGYTREEDPRLVEFSNIMFEVQPPKQSQRLTGLNGEPLRKLAEKGADINGQIFARFVTKGDSVYDMFGGSCGLGLVGIMRDAGHYYFATESDETVIEPAQNRLGKAFMLRDRHRAQFENSLCSLNSFQTLATSVGSFVLPANNVPTHLGSGKPLGNHPAANIDILGVV